MSRVGGLNPLYQTLFSLLNIKGVLHEVKKTLTKKPETIFFKVDASSQYTTQSTFQSLGIL
jgi:hypothetical protein